jgi:hypothetical protein
MVNHLCLPRPVQRVLRASHGASGRSAVRSGLVSKWQDATGTGRSVAPGRPDALAVVNERNRLSYSSYSNDDLYLR